MTEYICHASYFVLWSLSPHPLHPECFSCEWKANVCLYRMFTHLTIKKTPNSFYRTDTPLRLGGEWVRLYFLLLNLLPFKTGHFSLLDTNLHKKSRVFFCFIWFSHRHHQHYHRVLPSVLFFFLFFLAFLSLFRQVQVFYESSSTSNRTRIRFWVILSQSIPFQSIPKITITCLFHYLIMYRPVDVHCFMPFPRPPVSRWERRGTGF